MRSTIWVSAFLLATTLAPAFAHAEAESDGVRSAVPPAGATATAQTTSPESRLEALEKKVGSLQDENKELASQVSDLQESQSQANEPPSELGKMKIFGFFDMNFQKTYYSPSNSVLGAVLPMPTHSTFMATGLNVFLANQITERLKFLSELRFTYLPLGNETGTQTYVVLPNGSTMNLGTKYTRTDTTVTDPSAQIFRLGGVGIERLQLTYVFNDYLAVTAGHFLTPYGIWNVDHGSPVILMVHAPIFQTILMVPTQQTGIQLFGRVYLSQNLSLDYGGTISNGRGPEDSVIDLDDNKGLGLRWHLNYELDDFSIAMGQYGYTGQYTDISKAIYSGPGTADSSSSTTVTEQYTERILASDVLIKFFGIRLQGEAVLRRVKYDVPPPISPADFNGNPALAAQYNSASYDAHAYYGLLAYELPAWLTTSKIRLTPFVYFERFNLNDTFPSSANTSTIYSGGLNVKPCRGLVLKVEYDRFKGDDMVDVLPDGTRKTTNNGVGQIVTAQAAVTF